LPRNIFFICKRASYRLRSSINLPGQSPPNSKIPRTKFQIPNFKFQIPNFTFQISKKNNETSLGELNPIEIKIPKKFKFHPVPMLRDQDQEKKVKQSLGKLTRKRLNLESTLPRLFGAIKIS
jgi:hypothetical protein